ncbi:fatty acid desaturase [Hortaea werneckii]|nr:fatty acid desaturase [Hortaea werneckii]
MSNHLTIPLRKSINHIRDLDLLAKLHDQLLGGAEVAAVEEVQPPGTVDVHSGAQHALGKGLGDAEVRRAHGEVAERDLHVHRHGDHVADHDEAEAAPARGDALVYGQVRVPVPEEELAGDLEVAVPPGWTLPGPLQAEDVRPGEDVEIEAAEGEERVVHEVLVFKHELGDGVVRHDAVVVGALETAEEAVRDGEERHVLDVRVVLGAVRDDVVDVMVAFPPAAGEAAEEVGYEDADAGVDVEVVRYAHVAGVVDGEDELVPHRSQEGGREQVVSVLEEEVRCQAERCTCVTEPGVKLTIFADNIGLCGLIQARIELKVAFQLLFGAIIAIDLVLLGGIPAFQRDRTMATVLLRCHSRNCLRGLRLVDSPRHKVSPLPFYPANLIRLHKILGLGRMECPDFVRRVPSHHMQDGLVAAGMIGKPCVCLEYLVVHNHYLAAACDQGLNLVAGEDSLLAAGSLEGGHVCESLPECCEWMLKSPGDDPGSLGPWEPGSDKLPPIAAPRIARPLPRSWLSLPNIHRASRRATTSSN